MQLSMTFFKEGRDLGYVSKEVSEKSILAYFQIMRKGAFEMYDELLELANKDTQFTKELMYIILYGLDGKK